MKKASKYKSKYVVGRSFYSHLAFYIIITIFILTVLAFAITSFAYFLGIPLGDFPEDACIAESENFNVFYCLVIHGKDSRFYDLLYYFFIILIIVSILALIILNVIYIVNRFYFVRLVKEKSCGAVIYKVENGKVYHPHLFSGVKERKKMSLILFDDKIVYMGPTVNANGSVEKDGIVIMIKNVTFYKCKPIFSLFKRFATIKGTGLTDMRTNECNKNTIYFPGVFFFWWFCGGKIKTTCKKLK